MHYDTELKQSMDRSNSTFLHDLGYRKLTVLHNLDRISSQHTFPGFEYFEFRSFAAIFPWTQYPHKQHPVEFQKSP